MGGERETEVAKKETKSTSKKVTLDKYRVHQKDAEVHIHDDANKLKSAVPVVQWWKMWERLRNEPGTWTWLDPHFKTKLVVQTVLDETGVDVTISLSSITFGETWDKIDTFTKRK